VEEAIRKLVPPKALEVNLAAFRRGVEWSVNQ